MSKIEKLPGITQPNAMVSVDVTEAGVSRMYVRADNEVELRDGLTLLARLSPELHALNSRAKTAEERQR